MAGRLKGRWNKHEGKNRKKICPECENVFEVEPYRIEIAKYCSLKCRNKAYLGKIKKKTGTEKECACGNIFYCYKYDDRKFCSRECADKGQNRIKTTGIQHWNWRGGITNETQKGRKLAIYRIWRIAVFTRDDYTCQECGQHGGILNADHIKPWSLFPELRYAIDNGRTLCIDCHKETETYGYKIYKFKQLMVN